ncbi:MAG: gamma-glutamyl-gamma-aminobutyrate hydrolase family protein [Propionibacteriaceae bacterium]|nr:gamma-glutamyl-gamma-aminobutyrate hydrolase family protein [Propionibacteriaceae bacterium]
MAKPVIGVMPLWDEQRDSLWMLPGYLTGLIEAGAAPVVLPLTDDAELIEQLVDGCDGLVLTGGQDVDPAVYGAERQPWCGETNALLDRMEALVIARAQATDRPVLGICRGIQIMVALDGGDLYQDIATELSPTVPHTNQPGAAKSRHPVHLTGPLRELMGVAEIEITSFHHQGVKSPGPNYEVMATAPDGLIEAIRDPRYRWCWAVQWHPEMALADDATQRLFRAFVEACQQS